MPRVHTLRKIARTITFLALLTAVSNVVIFARQDVASLLATTAVRVPRAFNFAVALLTGLALLGFLAVMRRAAPSIGSFVHYLWAVPRPSYAALEFKDQIAAENALRANRIQVITTAAQIVGGTVLLVGVYFSWANLKTLQEGQITDRFTKAIDQLGATDEKGNPRMELRLGGIYALERIAQESEKDHWPIMEVLTTYVRVHAPAKKTDEKPSDPGGANARSSHVNPPAAPVPIIPPSPDIQAILTVIDRRDLTSEKEKDERLDLSETNLEGAVLNGAHLERADLFDAHLEGAVLNGAYLVGAYLDGAFLPNAFLNGTYLPGAHLFSADLTDAHLEGAHLEGAYLEGASLNGAFLNGTDLLGTHLDGAFLFDSIGLTQRQVDSALGNKYTALPSGIVMPESWKHAASAPTTAQPKSLSLNLLAGQ